MNRLFYWGEVYMGITHPTLYRVDEASGWQPQQQQYDQVSTLIIEGYTEISLRTAVIMGWPT